jgi:hypothetical protein
MQLQASRNVDSNFTSARAKFNKHTFNSSLLWGALPPPRRGTLRLTCSIATATIILYICTGIHSHYKYITVSFRGPHTWGPLKTHDKSQQKCTHPQLRGGGKSTKGHKQPEEASSANPWTRASGSCNPPIYLKGGKRGPWHQIILL